MSVIAALAYTVIALVYNVPSYVPGFTTIVCLLLLLNGALMVQLGIMGEYLGRLFLEVKRRPSYLIESTVNYETGPEETSTSSERLATAPTSSAPPASATTFRD
jgi:hypothetical protein